MNLRQHIISGMEVQSTPPRRIVVAANPQVPEAADLAEAIAGHLTAEGIRAAHGLLYDEAVRQAVESRACDLLVALGGDGTMLRAGHLCAPHEVPILGINLGRMGFLTEVRRDGWREALAQVLAGRFWLEQRMMLRAEWVRSGQVEGAWDVLNECLVGRGEVVRPVRLRTEIDGRYLTTYVADGLIIATATGSTAYALAAGGPVLPPQLRNILLVPVAPHLSFDRAIVLHEGSTVRVTVGTDHKAVLSVDGQVPVHLGDGDQVEVCAGPHSARFVRLQDPGYFYRNLTSYLNNRTEGHRA